MFCTGYEQSNVQKKTPGCGVLLFGGVADPVNFDLLRIPGFVIYPIFKRNNVPGSINRIKQKNGSEHCPTH